MEKMKPRHHRGSSFLFHDHFVTLLLYHFNMTLMRSIKVNSIMLKLLLSSVLQIRIDNRLAIAQDQMVDLPLWLTFCYAHYACNSLRAGMQIGQILKNSSY